ncbi:MAG TPA: TolC family protein, partial [Puia sp.]|nr:TolC family protein [Puia sp.]
MKSCRYFLPILSLLLTLQALAQKEEVVLQDATIEQCIQYALQHQPSVNQSMIDEQITDKAIKGKLADWLPQINLTANYQNNFMLPSTKFG